METLTSVYEAIKAGRLIDLKETNGKVRKILMNGSEEGPYIDINQLKKIRVELEAFNESNQTPEFQKFFFKDKIRNLHPTNEDNNLPKAVLVCLRYLEESMDNWFVVEPEYQNNTFIKDYPIEKSAVVLRIRAKDQIKKKSNDKEDIDSYINSALSYKNEGNEQFIKENYIAAEKSYLKGIRNLTMIPKKKLFELQSKHIENNSVKLEIIDKLKIDLLNNHCMSCIKLNRYSDSINDCKEILELYPSNEKALYRLGLSYELSGEFELAINSYEKIGFLEKANILKTKIKNHEKELSLRLFRGLNKE